MSFREELQSVHSLIVEATRSWLIAEFPLETWGTSAKRRPIDLVGLHPWIGAKSQPFSELVNQLATIERLLEALDWSVVRGLEEVVACHPTTSSGAHDLVARGEGPSVCVFEVSDVAGASGDANQKMAKDLRNLARCACIYCSEGAEKYLATSPTSGDWLSKLNQKPSRLVSFGVEKVTLVTQLPHGTTISRVS